MRGEKFVPIPVMQVGEIVLLRNGEGRREHCFYEKTDVSMYTLTEEEIDSYISSGDPMDKAGSYGIQGRFAIHIKGIHGDYNNVVGLPVARLYQELRKLGVDV